MTGPFGAVSDWERGGQPDVAFGQQALLEHNVD